MQKTEEGFAFDSLDLAKRVIGELMIENAALKQLVKQLQQPTEQPSNEASIKEED